VKFVYAIPLFGWMLKDAVHGPSDSKYWFIADMLMLWALAIIFFGYPAIIIPALTAVPIMLALIVMITWG
jgi:hypothetical protein